MTTPTRGERDLGYGRTARTYQIPGTDRLYDSVTTILTILAKPALINWAANQERFLVSEAAADLYDDMPMTGKKLGRPAFLATLSQRIGKTKASQRELAKAAEIGGMVHALVEWNLRTERGELVGPQPRINEPAAAALARWEDWRREVLLRPLAIEQVVWSDRYEYAGTLDLYAEATLPVVGRCRLIADWKTGKAIYDEALLQIAAYFEAFREMGHIEDDLPVYGLVLRLPKVASDPAFEARLVPANVLSKYFEIFLAAKACWDWQQLLRMERDAPSRTPDAAPEPGPVAEPSTAVSVRAIAVISNARQLLGDHVVATVLERHGVRHSDIQRTDPTLLAAVMAQIETLCAERRTA